MGIPSGVAQQEPTDIAAQGALGMALAFVLGAGADGGAVALPVLEVPLQGCGLAGGLFSWV